MLQNENILLRAPEPSDVDFLFELENDIKLWHVSQTRNPLSRFDMEQYIFSLEKDPFKAGNVRFIIESAVEKNILGTVDLFEIDALNKRAGVGIVILEKHRNKGYAFEALSLVKKYSFEVLDLHQLYCNIETDNELSLKLFTSAGYEISGVKKEWNRKNGRWIDEYFLQLINSI